MLTTCVYSGAAGFFCPAPATLPAHYMARRALQNLRSAMISYFKPVLLLFLWLQCHTGFASGNEQLEQLSSHRVWLTLLHYEPVLFGSGSRSAIDSENYFLSSNGRRNPLAELRATVTALGNPVVNANDHAQCKFPARYLWLRKHVESLRHAKPVVCAEYAEWLKTGAISSISMVFATGHMKSPASFFGHNFLKFNSANRGGSNDLLDDTINFGAEVPENEGGLTYFYKGIFGGYSAVFERQPFFRHMAKYGEEDLRDVWEYELNLSDEQIKIILAHTWELQKADLTYYFFRKNCAYQIAKLIALVSPARLIPKLLPWTMPYNVFSKLAKARINGEPLVRDIRYHPSRRSRFHQRYFALSDTDRSFFSSYVTGDVTLNSEIFDQRSMSSKLDLIDVLIDYFEFRLRLDGKDDVAASEKNKLLIKRFTLPITEKTNVSYSKPFAPHLAQRPGYLAFSKLNNSSFGGATELRVRPAYFDFLSLDRGRSTTGVFTLLDTTVLIQNDNISLRGIDLLNVTNLAPSITGIPGDSGTSWNFRVGFNNTNNACTSCRRLMADTMIGKASRLNRSLTGYAFAGARLQSSYERDNTLVLKLSAGLAGKLLPGVRLNTTIERHEDTGSNGLDRNRVNIELGLGESKSWDVRFRYTRDVAEEWSLSAGYFW